MDERINNGTDGASPDEAALEDERLAGVAGGKDRWSDLLGRPRPVRPDWLKPSSPIGLETPQGNECPDCGSHNTGTVNETDTIVYQKCGDCGCEW